MLGYQQIGHQANLPDTTWTPDAFGMHPGVHWMGALVPVVSGLWRDWTHSPVYVCLRQWPVTYLITLSDWTMSCQPGPPRVRYGQWPRWQQRPAGGTFPYKMANFHGVYLIFGRIDSTEFSIWYRENCLSYCHKISNWYNDPVLCYHRVKYAILQLADKGAAIIFTSMRERHLRKCPDA